MDPSDKQAIRRQARAARAAQVDKEGVSRQILAKAMDLEDYRSAGGVMFYVDVRNEVRTRRAIQQALCSAKLIAVPYCSGDTLELFLLKDWEHLAPGKYGILEPSEELRNDRQYQVQPERIDLVFTPGVAFDREGRRYGHGKGYYDRLLGTLPCSTRLVGLAYDCQVYRELETERHDVVMDCVVTQTSVHTRK